MKRYFEIFKEWCDYLLSIDGVGIKKGFEGCDCLYEINMTLKAVEIYDKAYNENRMTKESVIGCLVDINIKFIEREFVENNFEFTTWKAFRRRKIIENLEL